MPWCGPCRSEYREGMTRCADCGAELVNDLAQWDAAQRAAAAARVLRIVAPGGTIAALAAWLEPRRIPSRREADGSLLVPLGAAEAIEAQLMQVAEFERVGDVLHVYGARQDLEPELRPDPAWLARSPDELAADLPAALDGLVALFASPSPRHHAQATQRLAALEAAGRVDCANLFVAAARQHVRRPLYAWAAQLAAAPPAGFAGRLVAAAAQAPTAVAIVLLHAAAQLRDPAVAPLALPLLEHADGEVREEADELLVSLAGFDVGFDADAEPADRARAIALWREWIAKGDGKARR